MVDTTSKAYQQCHALIPQLNKDEKLQIRQWLDASLGHASLELDFPSLADDWLAQAIGRAMMQRGQLNAKNVNLELARAARRVKTFTEASEAQRGWILMNFQPSRAPTKAVEFIHLGDVVVKALSQHIVWMSSVDTETLMRNVHRIPAAIDEQLPGYIASGLFDLVTLKEKQK